MKKFLNQFTNLNEPSDWKNFLTLGQKPSLTCFDGIEVVPLITQKLFVGF